SDHHPAVWPNTVAPEHFPRLGPACHLLEGRRGAVHERHPRITYKTSRICGLPEANGDNISRNFQVFDGLGQGETVGWNETGVGLDVDEGVGVELLGVDDGRVDVSKDLVVAADADVVTVGTDAVGDDAGAHGRLSERLDD